MSPDTVNRFWLFITLTLIVIILISGIFIWTHRDNGQQLVITPNPPAELQAETMIDGSVSNPQKIDINRADVWLLQALPGIGETKAQAIVDYRIQNGLFRVVEDITKVPGIGASVFDKIKPFITVSGD
jgi:comEA protein